MTISQVAGGTETPAIQGIADTHDTENPSEKDPSKARTSTETRPKNIYVHFIIKCR